MMQMMIHLTHREEAEMTILMMVKVYMWKNEKFCRNRSIQKVDPAVDNLLNATCFGIFKDMAKFHCSNEFLDAIISFMDDDGEKFCFQKYNLYIGLEDIHNITGLPVDGKPIVCGDFNPSNLILEMLGKDDPLRKPTSFYVRKDWLQITFQTVPAEANGEDLKRYARAYILFLMGTLLFPENQKPTIFVGYLPMLKDLSAQSLNSFAWGTAVLAKLQSAFKIKSYSQGATWIVEMFFLERIPSIKEYLGIPDPKKCTTNEFPSFLYWGKKLKYISKNSHLNIEWKALMNDVRHKRDAEKILEKGPQGVTTYIKATRELEDYIEFFRKNTNLECTDVVNRANELLVKTDVELEKEFDQVLSVYSFSIVKASSVISALCSSFLPIPTG